MVYQYKKLSVNVEVAGEGDALILLHGWGCDHTIFDSYRDLLSRQYKLFIFDLPGFGSSDEPDSIWGIQDYVDMLRGFIVDNSIENPTLAGHSFGGRMLILYASQHEVSKVILIDAAGIVPKRSAKYYMKVYSFKFIKNVCQLLLPKETAKRIIDKRRGKSASSDYSNATPAMRAILSKVVNEDLRSVMPKISAPTLLFWGDADTATPIADARIMAKLIPDSGLVVATGCGHYSFLENRGLFTAVVKKFLNIE